VLFRSADGSFANGGKFVKRKKANKVTTHDVEAHEIVIPPRPFLEPGVIAAQEKTTPQLASAARAALKGDIAGAQMRLGRAGLEAVNSVRAVMTEGIDPPLADSTIRNRRSRGRTGTTPLIDKGELRNAITYVVRKK